MKNVYKVFDTLHEGGKLTNFEKLDILELEKALEVLAKSITVEYFENGKINSLETFNSCDYNTKKLIWLFGSNYISNFFGLSKHPKYNTLTPLAMYALKETKGLKYELWHDDRNDKDFEKHWLGQGLKDLPFSEIIEFEKGDLEGTNLALYNNIPRVMRTLRLKSKKRLSVILSCQLWAAHPTKRMPGVQILSPINWDATPKAIWEIQDTIEEDL